MKTTSTHSVHCAVRERLSNTNLSKKNLQSQNVGRITQCTANNKESQENRGKSQKSHEGDNRTKSESRAHTDMTPDDYLQVLESTDLKDNEKLPHTIMSHWKIVNDQSKFFQTSAAGKRSAWQQ